MRVQNATHWRTDHLRAIITRVAQDELDPERRRRYVVKVGYNHSRNTGGSCSGHAAYHGRVACVNVPSDTVDAVDFAHVVAHEMAHSRGMKHVAMRGSRRYNRIEGWRDYYSWAAALLIERKPERARPTRNDRRALRLSHAETMLARWERKAKAATRRAARWRGRVKDARRYIAIAAEKAARKEDGS